MTVGGASKTFWGGLRVGWIRAPRDLMPALVSARLTLDLGSPGPGAARAHRAARPPRRDPRRPAARHRADRVTPWWGRCAAACPSGSSRVPEGGLCLWAELPEALSTPLCAAADRRGVVLAPGSQFAVEGGMERFLRLPFTGHAPEVVADAVARIALAWEDAVAPTTRGSVADRWRREPARSPDVPRARDGGRPLGSVRDRRRHPRLRPADRPARHARPRGAGHRPDHRRGRRGPRRLRRVRRHGLPRAQPEDAARTRLRRPGARAVRHGRRPHDGRHRRR